MNGLLLMGKMKCSPPTQDLIPDQHGYGVWVGRTWLHSHLKALRINNVYELCCINNAVLSFLALQCIMKYILDR